ncbi:MAG: undecaprenyl-diphosphate phosphatase [Bacteroidales bacterium]|nr:undecaprenyl-diphosphate phosphatase [Bacteroidales bacterium]
MSILEAIILGVIQGLTEFLPVSSSGHIELGKAILGVEIKDSIEFTVAVHAATVLSTLVVFRKEIASLFAGFFKFKMNPETQFVLKILVSTIPVLLVGLFLKEKVEALFDGNLLVVGFMLLVTATLLALTKYFKKTTTKPIGYRNAFIIGIAQAIAVMPGLSRSGSTISTGLILGNHRDEVAKFSFLMVIIPILGAAILDLAKGEFASVDIQPLAAGFVAAFVSGYIACSWMIKLVRKGNLIWFAAYCAIAGTAAIIYSL